MIFNFVTGRLVFGHGYLSALLRFFAA